MMVFASEVPVVSAMNPYRKIEDVFMTTWKRTNRKQVEALEKKLDLVVRTPEQKMEAIVEDLGVTQSIQALVEEASVAATIADVAQAAAKIQVVLPSTTPDDVKKEVTQFVASEMNKSFGAKQETPAILAYEQQQQVAVQERNLAFHKRKLAAVGAYDLYVGGKIDGRADGKVVEVKNRVSRFMSPLPKYDIAQLQTYLFILEATEGELVEHLRNDQSQTKLTPVAWDPHLWDSQIAPFVVRFGSALAHFMDNEQAQEQFLTADQPHIQKEIIRQHWTMEPTA